MGDDVHMPFPDDLFPGLFPGLYPGLLSGASSRFFAEGPVPGAPCPGARNEGAPEPESLAGGGVPHDGGPLDQGGAPGTAGGEGPGAPERPVVVLAGGRQEGPGAGDHEDQGETVPQPAKVMRIASMVRQLLEEVRHAPLDQASRSRLAEVYDTAVRELSEGLSPDLASELGRITGPFETSVPSDAELRVAQAQLVGWLEGLFHGIQATMYAQQMAERSRVEESARRGLPPADDAVLRRPGTYL